MKFFFVLLGLAILEGCNSKLDKESKEDLGNIVEDVVSIVEDEKDRPKESVKLAADVVDLVFIHPEEKDASK